jgi:uncharacterized Zn finger protein
MTSSGTYQSWWESHGPLLPADGIKARTQRGEFGKTWWASRWIAALERVVNHARLVRGRSYARTGRVLSLDVSADGIVARVLGTRKTPYEVHVRFRALSAADWDDVLERMASQAIYAARLLSEEMPEDIEDVFAAAGHSLFPSERRDMQTRCSCPDQANPCKHIAAVHYLLGERFEDDPFLMFLLRGRTKDEILDALRARRLAPVAESEPATSDASAGERDLSRFWIASAAAGDIALKFASPEVDALPIKQLGPAPFVREPQELVAAMEETYRAISRYALRLALDDS